MANPVVARLRRSKTFGTWLERTVARGLTKKHLQACIDHPEIIDQFLAIANQRIAPTPPKPRARPVESFPFTEPRPSESNMVRLARDLQLPPVKVYQSASFVMSEHDRGLANTFGKNFHGLDTVQQLFTGLRISHRMAHLPIRLYSEKERRYLTEAETDNVCKSRRATHLLVATFPETMREFYARHQIHFVDDMNQALYYSAQAPWAVKPFMRPWMLVRKNVLKGSEKKDIGSHAQLVKKTAADERQLEPQEAAYVALLHFLATKEKLWSDDYVIFPVQVPGTTAYVVMEWHFGRLKFSVSPGIACNIFKAASVYCG